jgi:hypothetical protein
MWDKILGQSGFKLKRMSTLITAIKQTAGDQRTLIIKEFATHLQISRRYHRLHRSFDEDFKCRLHALHRYFDKGFIHLLYLKLVLTMTIILLLLLLRKSKTNFSFC